MTMKLFWPLFLTVVFLSACTTDPGSLDCQRDPDCGVGFMCSAQRCLPRPEVTITFFAGPSDPVAVGQTVTLNWTLQFATRASILVDDQSIYDIPVQDLESGSFQTRVDKATDFVLSATNGESTVTAITSVSLQTFDPAIVTFDADPPIISLGGRSTLRWETEFATSGRILDDANQLVVDIDSDDLPRGSSVIEPQASARYRLIIANAFGEQEKEIAVQVLDALPGITSFAATRPELVKGESTTLFWEVSNADTITLRAGDATLANTDHGSSELEVAPEQTTTYVLTANNAAGSAEAELTIHVYEALSVAQFTATPDKVSPGDSTTLSWVIDGEVSTFGIRDSQGNVLDTSNVDPVSGSIEVFPTQTTWYVLSVSNPVQTASAAATVTVLPPKPTITSFLATPTTVAQGSTTRLEWATVGATSITITDDMGASIDTTNRSPLSDSIEVVVAADRTYTLVASNAGGQVSASIAVSAVEGVEIRSFDADIQEIAAGEPVRLTWTTNGATNLSLTANGQPVDIAGKAANDFLDVNPTTTTSYELTADGLPSPTSATALVIVRTPVTVSSFIATPATITEGAQTTLSWNATGALSATLECVDDATLVRTAIDLSALNPNTGNLTVSPTASATCTFTASGFRGPTSASAGVTVIPNLATIVSFHADTEVIATGQTIELDWQTTHATTLALSDSAGTPVDISTLNIDSDRVTLTPLKSTTYILSASNPHGTAIASVDIVVVDTHNLFINEVFYDARSADDGLEFVELYNAGESFIDLQYFSLGAGGAGYSSLGPLSGMIAPHGCFVVGGPISSPDNNNASFDLAMLFTSPLQNGSAVSDGVALFFGDSITPTSIPTDSVLYEGLNTSSLLGEDGLPDTEISPAASSASIKRVSLSDIFVVGPMDAGMCANFKALSVVKGSNQASGALQILGWALDADLMDVALGTQSLTCANISGGIECVVSADTQVGPVDLTLTQSRRYIDDGSGNAVPGAVTSPQTITVADAYTFENEVADPGPDFWCAVTTPNTVSAPNTVIVAQAEIYVAGSTDTTGSLPAAMAVEAVLGDVANVQSTYPPDIMDASVIGTNGNNVVVSTTITHSTPRHAELAFRVTTDGINYIWCDTVANHGSDDGYSSGTLISWQ